MTVGRAAVRSEQWWDHKIPPLVAVAALVIGASTRASAGAEVLDVLLLLVAAAGVAAFGHVVNDLADLGPDAAAGKRNVLAMVGPVPRVLLVLGSLAVGLVPFLWLPHTAVVLALVAAEVALLTLYSVPPVRLKERGLAGVAADAAYAYVLPVALTMAVMSARPGGADLAWWVVAPVLCWSFLMGLRGILWHQLLDLDNDRRAGVTTLVTRLGLRRTERLAGRLVVVESVVAVAAVAAVGAAGPRWLWWFAAAYLAWRLFQVTVLWTDDPLLPAALHDTDSRLRLLGFVIGNEFVEKWLPVAAMVALAWQRPAWWAALAVYLLVFDNAVVEFFSRDSGNLPDALERAVLERRARTALRAARAERDRVSAVDRSAGGSRRTDRRWVFVVCGPELHVRTLATGVRHLRPLTDLEIWVLTDSRRNEVPIDASMVDGVVDVATPDELDDHQASIWLKTSVHRHLPPGEWCYLDTDVIATAPGGEAVFDHRGGPVAFASDLTISANQVDRFSPWAMTCDCSGHGDQHSCAHLREQLRDRLHVEVPADWVHWNGGVFVFGTDSAPVLDRWHRTAVASFDWPEWRTRDQGALIATVWQLGLQDLPRLPSEFNFIADLGNTDLVMLPDRGWALHPAGPWLRPRFLHLYTSRLEDDGWDLFDDVEAPVIRSSVVRLLRWRRSERISGWQHSAVDTASNARVRAQGGVNRVRFRYQWLRYKASRLPARLTPSRVTAALRRRLGQGADDAAGTEPPVGTGSRRTHR